MKTYGSMIELQQSGIQCGRGGVVYLLCAETLVKIGSSFRPVERIGEQRVIGYSYGYAGERTSEIHISGETEKFREIESAIKKAAFPGLRFAAFGVHGGARPKEVFHASLKPLILQAIRKANNWPTFIASLVALECAASSLRPVREWIKPAPSRHPRKPAAV